jgi:chromosome segregation ATPase
VSDPFDRALAAFAEARSERDTLKSRAEKARLEIHQLRRRLQVAEDQNRTLLERVADADQRAETAEREAGSARRAMLDHAGRT